ncbi:type VI secretion protein IcmF/TssM N-terminal domain-containing protein [Dongshaea marina]|uniref:type VI secretion protein IcmF/TssM N-terminal domain-containing protein n=1 Tax=Dongshaea marina TaxID=2047966 RepID=UPI000D3E396C|nr:type VI secretion protein IcmF/TssM N-terminal domain-containing protein [Dongshaea marina]
MGKFFWGLLKWLLLCVLIGLVAGGVFYLVKIYEWPWWVGGIALAGIAGLVALGILLRRYLLRHREKQFVERIVESDARRIAEAQQIHKLRYQELQQRWLDAVNTLRSSRLRKQGNPLYVLPWYLVFGESDSGKSSAISHCGLTSVLSKVGPVAGVSSTHNCDWWFFEEAVVLDTAGRYAVPINDHEDEQEWLDFLVLLARYRKREPVNGIMITLPADKLLKGRELDLQEYGRYIGARLDRLTRVMGARIPVYLMITKADQIYGFVDYASGLSLEEKRQGFGYTNSAELPVSQLIPAALDDMVKRLNRQLIKERPSHVGSGRLALASELGLLAEPIKEFCNSAFGHQNYHEAALLRGLYLTSAMQPGEQTSLTLGEMSVSRESDKSEGLFLYDLFARLLPEDRNLFEPISEFLRWRTLTSNLTLVTVLLLSFATVGILSLGYIDSDHSIRTLDKQLKKTMAVQGSVEQEILSLQALQQTMDEVQQDQSQWYLPKLTLQDPVYEALDRGHRYFVKRFEKKVLDPINNQLLRQVQKMGSDASFVAVGDAADHLSWQLSVIQARLKGNSLPGLSGWAKGNKSLAGVDVEYQNAFARLFVSYVRWQSEPQQLYDLASITRLRLSQVLATRTDLYWVTRWASDKVSGVSASDFWQLPLSKSLKVPGAYTEKGNELINTLLTQILDTSGLADIQDRIKRFKTWYGLRYVQHWKQFNKDFVASGQNLSSADRKLIALTLNNQNNPFISLQRRTLKELSVIQDLVKVNLSSLRLSQGIIDSYWAHQEKGASGVISQGRQLFSSAVTGAQETDPKYFQLLSQGEKYYQLLEKGLTSMLPSVSSEAGAAQSMGKIFSYSGGGTGPTQAYTAVQKLKQLFSEKEQVLSINGAQVFQNMYQFIMDTGLDLAACRLQSEWESDLYGALKYIPQSEQRSRLFSSDGLLSKFLSGPAKPFIELQADGWHPASYQGLQLPFKRDFFNFIEQGSYLEAETKDSYQIHFEALPIDVNPGAKQKPYQSTLTLQCTDAPQQLENFNYPTSATFTWKPKSCGTTRLEIDFNGLELTKTWQGKQGFQQFLQAFRSGQVDFTSADFPDKAQFLQELGIQWIRAKYQIDGALPILSLVKGDKLAIPLEITQCQGGLGS